MKKWHPLFFQDLGPWLQESIPPLPHESLFFEMRCSRFKTEKSPSPQILRSRIMDRYSGVLTLWYFLKNAGYQLLASTSHQIPALSKQLGRFGQRIQALPSTWLQRKYLPVDLLQFSLWYVSNKDSFRADDCVQLWIVGKSILLGRMGELDREYIFGNAQQLHPPVNSSGIISTIQSKPDSSRCQNLSAAPNAATPGGFPSHWQDYTSMPVRMPCLQSTAASIKHQISHLLPWLI